MLKTSFLSGRKGLILTLFAFLAAWSGFLFGAQKWEAPRRAGDVAVEIAQIISASRLLYINTNSYADLSSDILFYDPFMPFHYFDEHGRIMSPYDTPVHVFGLNREGAQRGFVVKAQMASRGCVLVAKLIDYQRISINGTPAETFPAAKEACEKTGMPTVSLVVS